MTLLHRRYISHSRSQSRCRMPASSCSQFSPHQSMHCIILSNSYREISDYTAFADFVQAAHPCSNCRSSLWLTSFTHAVAARIRIERCIAPPPVLQLNLYAGLQSTPSGQLQASWRKDEGRGLSRPSEAVVFFFCLWNADSHESSVATSDFAGCIAAVHLRKTETLPYRSRSNSGASQQEGNKHAQRQRNASHASSVALLESTA